MPMDRQMNQVELGNYLYLFISPVQTEQCLITAHGGYHKNQSSFSLSKIAKDTEIRFYGEHHKVLRDPGLGMLSRRPVVVNSHPRDGDQVLDYVLSKYQGRHSEANETYQKLSDHQNRDGAQLKLFNSQLEAVNADPALRRIYDSLNSCHIVTIRNRWNKSDVSLRYVVSEVKKKLPSVKIFHCSFCRSLIGDANPAVSVVQTAA